MAQKKKHPTEFGQFRKRNQNQNSGNGDSERNGGFNFYWIYIVLIAVIFGIQLLGMMNSAAKKSSFNELTTYLLSDDVERIRVVNSKEIQVFLRQESIKTKEEFKDLRSRSTGSGVVPGPHLVFQMPGDAFRDELRNFYEDNPNLDRRKVPITYEEQRDYWSDILAWVLPFLFIFLIWMFIMRRMSSMGGGPGGQIFNIGKSRAQLFDKNTNVKVTFKDVAGMEGAKEEIQEIVNFLKNPEKYTNLGGKIPKGALLAGPPGTGKTLLAKAVAGEAKVPFFSLSGSDFVEMFVGVGASRVRDLFKQAKEKAPSIIFIDEIDAIGRARGKASFSGGNDERENTLNQLLTEMDGFQTNETVIVLAATNRPEILDRALTRAGRFDRTIYIDLPDLNERKEIFKIHLRRIKHTPDLDIDFLAKQTPGFSGADIANVCNEAALIAARKDKKVVELQDFLDAVDRIVAGLEKKSKIITPEEKKVIAYHEAGHATVSWMLEHAAPLVKVTIVPRGRSLGAAWYLPEERQITTAEQIQDEMCAALGGRAAEKVIFNKVSTGALSDLEKVTRQAQAMVTIFGLNERIGNITYYDSSGQNEFGFNKPYSEKTAEIIDEEVKKIVDLQYERAIEILTTHKEKLIQLAELLLEKEVIFKQDLEQIFGKRKWDKEADSQSNTTELSKNESEAEKEQKDEAELSGATVSAQDSKD
ncbi:ATP-dependent zinc metalloprotease FtsH [Thermaurantimonas aggregans]|uniref:ATP-dependent zinc metalloprotease FtsH n=1 Tax=Thermaurantimonas aggregans TaxID=2173829 RepID=A0A401XJG8_9FLAO|nr:ATP-dependent zinc metalloprotease FtsH [Thermaurantimonas aggregans]GCD77121.1 ATP-dependent zinc metalloprotease FtsH [Thermaurantimonas aggregans]